MENIVLLGATGSIGKSVLDVIRNYPGVFRLYGISGYQNRVRLKEIVREFHPVFVAIKEDSKELSADFPDIEFLSGEKGLTELAALPETDTVVIAVSGISGLLPTLSAIRSKKKTLSANKESIVAAGGIVNLELSKTGGQILPLDSEHNAVFNLLAGRKVSEVESICLTASGGPFLRHDAGEKTTREDVLRHPTWSMGNYITVNCATLMNKGFEVIEAHYLFRFDYERIRVLIHPQSVVHGALQMKDGTFLLSASPSDMRYPIALSMFYPHIPEQKFPLLDLTKTKLDFSEPDFKRFPLLETAYQAGKSGGAMPAILNAANEAAVGAFLNGRLMFYRLPDVILRTVDSLAGVYPSSSALDLSALMEADKKAGETVNKIIKGITGEVG